ncbi:MAG: hypothetical protein JEZ07_13290 [Phycisphaerae bacterium]|nr:hypothetical protein [Phycisphaerae bacterium]
MLVGCGIAWSNFVLFFWVCVGDGLICCGRWVGVSWRWWVVVFATLMFILLGQVGDDGIKQRGHGPLDRVRAAGEINIVIL